MGAPASVDRTAAPRLRIQARGCIVDGLRELWCDIDSVHDAMIYHASRVYGTVVCVNSTRIQDSDDGAVWRVGFEFGARPMV